MRIRSSGSCLATQQVLGQPGLHKTKTLSLKEGGLGAGGDCYKHKELNLHPRCRGKSQNSEGRAH